MKVRRTVLASLLAALMLVGTAGSALATHTHVLLLGNGQCAVLAPEGGEKYVELPNAGELPEGRRHPLHVNVHLGEPGQRHGQPVIFVQGSDGDLDNCEGYVNR